MTVSLPGATSLYVSAAALADELAAEAEAEAAEALADALAAEAEALAADALADALPDPLAAALLEELPDVQPTSASVAARAPAATSAMIFDAFIFFPFL